MQTENLETIQLLREVETDGHSPMQFLCSNQAIYYLKYRSGKSFDSQELNFLIYEVLCSLLLKKLEIPTPDIALVRLQEGSYESQQLKANKRYAKPNKICFASKEIPNCQVVMGFEKVNHIINPLDLIRIAIFDIWVDNADRGKKLTNGGYNYNLLLKSVTNGYQIIAFDHAFTFGGQQNIGIFSEKVPISKYNKLLDSDFFTSLMPFIPKNERINVADDFIERCQKIDINTILEQMKNNLPDEWYINPYLSQNLYQFLTSSVRWENIQKLIYETL